MQIYGTEVNSMEDACERLQEWYEDEDLDIWYEFSDSTFDNVIFIEDNFDPDHSVTLCDLDEVRKFCESASEDRWNI